MKTLTLLAVFTLAPCVPAADIGGGYGPPPAKKQDVAPVFVVAPETPSDLTNRMFLNAYTPVPQYMPTQRCTGPNCPQQQFQLFPRLRGLVR